MRIAGNYTFEATREEVWSALNNPEVLALVIPGCQRLDEVGEHEYESTLKVGLQAVRGVYNGRVKLDNLVAPESYDIHVDGKGSNGFLNGKGSIKLREEGASTILDYGGEAHVGGTIASVGQRLLDGAAKTLINQSLKALAQQIAQRRAGPPASVAEPVTPAAEPVTPAAEPAIPVAEPATSTAAPAALGTANNPTSAAAPAPAAAPPAVTTAEPPAAPPDPFDSPTVARRSISIPEGQGLSEADVARGAVEDFFKERPWAPWVIVAFLLGIILGRRN